ncbi:MAG: biotin--[Clostridia bacterium]|nr:biotin--[acetyl-CoA-carboxylase] ligase [Clostridia bacterium]
MQFSIIQEQTLPSTNAILKEMAKGGAPEGTVLVALRQTAGYGRHGRSFFSPEGTGLYFSLLLRPSFAAADAPHLTPLAAVALALAVERLFPVRAEIKWVNDLYLDGKKAAGILSESALGTDGALAYTVVGVGVNLLPPVGGFPEGLLATALLPEGGEPSRAEALREALLAAFLEEFAIRYEKMPRLDFLTEYRRRSFLDGRRVLVHNAAIDTAKTGKGRPALVLGITESGALAVRYEDGREDVLCAGEVTLRLGE